MREENPVDRHQQDKRASKANNHNMPSPRTKILHIILYDMSSIIALYSGAQSRVPHITKRIAE